MLNQIIRKTRVISELLPTTRRYGVLNVCFGFHSFSYSRLQPASIVFIRSIFCRMSRIPGYGLHTLPVGASSEDGIQLAYYDTGAPAQNAYKTLVIMHGLNYSSRELLISCR